MEILIYGAGCFFIAYLLAFILGTLLTSFSLRKLFMESLVLTVQVFAVIFLIVLFSYCLFRVINII